MFHRELFVGLLILAALGIAQDMPRLKLPWGTWEATTFPGDDEIYLFKDVRFGAKPKRFGAPEFPDWEDDQVQNVTEPTTCIQVDLTKVDRPPGGRNPFGDPIKYALPESEDCLFLDIYVPAKVFREDIPRLPVVAYIYGGGYVMGSKSQWEPLYTGETLLKASNYETIMVAGNYRVGAYGWLAGSYMEKVGQPNAGLYDQALMLEWIHKYVERVGGDNNAVSAWGESAGGGSILHHLIREDGTHDPLFNTFAIQSPAFQWAWDNSTNGLLDNVYRNLSESVGCGYEYDIHCLRDVDAGVLARANQEIFSNVKQTGLFPVGPSVDGKWITSLPVLLLSQGKRWEQINAGMISHCENEAEAFTPKHVDNQEDFDLFLLSFLPEDRMEPERDDIRKRYNCRVRFGGNYNKCLGAMIRDSTFTCNTRNVFEAYKDRTWTMSYGFPTRKTAFHGTDLVPMFMNESQAYSFLMQTPSMTEKTAKWYASRLERVVTGPLREYYSSFAVSQSPNAMLGENSVRWPKSGGKGNRLTSVMRVGLNGFRLIWDGQNKRDTCAFWEDIATRLMDGQEKPAEGGVLPGDGGEL